ncbi:endothelin-converting enzyme 2 isoform X3 [Bactrocera neohumeralis]|nr:endothelin-converting enzyme 2 isoform X3 [Bactrocera neohumeralis]XP_050338185.1 endothelin-converting enzyme 2 isoform X3 [Bactrocera neohumeralis]
MQNQMSVVGSHTPKSEDTDALEGTTISNTTKYKINFKPNTEPGRQQYNIQQQHQKNATLEWMCCAPCIWLRTSTTVHKIAITTATILVTALLVASPILFLISTAPSRLPKECFSSTDECVSTSPPPIECTEIICQAVADSIQGNINWNLDPCTEFKNFSCSGSIRTTKTVRSIQGTVDTQMQYLLQHNTTKGPFRKLGRLFSSCMRQTTNSSTIKFVLEQLGGYLPTGTVGPTSISSLIKKMFKLGPTPLIDIYYDLSYGRRPQVLLIIGRPGTSPPILENSIRYSGPKAPPYQFKNGKYKLLKKLLDDFLPNELSSDQKSSEKETISTFIDELNQIHCLKIILQIRVEHTLRGFWNSSVLYNISSLQNIYPLLNWTDLLPYKWNNPIVVRSPDYIKAIEELLVKYSTRVVHNSMLILFTLGILPPDNPNPIICTRATMWALPDVTSAIFVTHHSTRDIKNAIKRTNLIFKSLKAYLKRAPSLKGAALVKLSSLRIQSQPWNGFTNITYAAKDLDSMDISSDDWFENILKIFGRNKIDPTSIKIDKNSHDTWAYPIISKVFYDTLSHSIVVPLSVMLVPYFDDRLPPYLQYASVGVHIAKEILRSITKSFEDKAIRCVPESVKVFSNHSQMEILIHSGGMQISYHSMLSITGPLKGMARLPSLNLTPTQIFFLVTSQELCEESNYIGIDTETVDFEHIDEKKKFGPSGGSPSLWKHFDVVHQIIGLTAAHTAEVYESFIVSSMAIGSPEPMSPEQEPMYASNYMTNSPLVSPLGSSTTAAGESTSKKRNYMGELIKVAKEQNELLKTVVEDGKILTERVVTAIEEQSSNTKEFIGIMKTILEKM